MRFATVDLTCSQREIEERLMGLLREPAGI